MDLRYIYHKLYDLFDIYNINCKLDKEIISPATITIPIIPDIRQARDISKLEDRISMWLGISDKDISLEQGKGRYHLTINKDHREDISLSTLLQRLENEHKEIYQNPLKILIGSDIFNSLILLNIGDKNPHIIIAGSSGSGKSNLLSNIISQIVIRDKKQAISLVIYSPKTDLDQFKGIPQLKYGQTIKEIRDIEISLSDIISIMESRSRGKESKYPILIILDEVNSLVALSDKAKGYIEQIAMKGRSERIHLILSMQSSKKQNLSNSPIIRENIISKIIFRVHSKRESTTLSNTPEIDCSKLRIGEAFLINHRGHARVQIPLDDIKHNTNYFTNNIVRKIEKREGIKELGDIRQFEALPERIRVYLVSSRGKEKGISKSILTKELNFSQPRSLELLSELDQLGILGDKEAPNLPSPINYDRLEELVRGADRLGTGYPQEVTREKAGIT